MKRNSGFTLAELLIVVVILGILGSIAMPKFFPQKEKAIVAEAVAMLGAIRQGQLAYNLEHAGYKNITLGGGGDADWADLGMGDPDNARFTYGTSAADSTAKRVNSDDTNFKDKTLVLAHDGTWDNSTARHPYQPKNV